MILRTSTSFLMFMTLAATSCKHGEQASHALGVEDGTSSVAGNETSSAVGSWTQLSGLEKPKSFTYGNYGKQGIASPTNVPGAREAPVSWTDKKGNFYIFGSSKGYGEKAEAALLNDLWKWDGKSWTWLAGNPFSRALGSWGKKGVAAPTNTPSGRGGSLVWTDAAGHAWLYGGQGNTKSYDSDDNTESNWGSMADFWKWDGKNWTWISGSHEAKVLPVAAKKGVASPSNHPGSRTESVTWTDSKGDFWLYGGFTIIGDYYRTVNDVWKWDGKNWTWVEGTFSEGVSPANGTKDVSSPPTSGPDTRKGQLSWSDGKGNLWVYSGTGDALWKWDGSKWTSIFGSPENKTRKYEKIGVASALNTPGGERSAGTTWIDGKGHLWLYGGAGYNDLWKWDGTAWIILADSVRPVPRGGSVSAIDGKGNVLIFGGFALGFEADERHDSWGGGPPALLNDLWLFKPST